MQDRDNFDREYHNALTYSGDGAFFYARKYLTFLRTWIPLDRLAQRTSPGGTQFEVEDGMVKQTAVHKSAHFAEALVKQGAKTEKRLLRREQRAEKSLDDARTKLQKAQMHLERRLSAVSDAEALLRTRQEARATGPGSENGAAPGAVGALIATSGDERLNGHHGAASTVSPIILAGGQPSQAVEPAPELELPPATKPPVRRRATRAAAAKDGSS